VPWWIPPAGFGCALTPDGLECRDYLALFTLRRGDWIDREFEKLTWGPKDENGAENRELDWPFPEMVGSTVSMLTAHTDQSGDAFFRWKLFDGERHWGFLVSTLERKTGTGKKFLPFNTKILRHACRSSKTGIWTSRTRRRGLMWWRGAKIC